MVRRFFIHAPNRQCIVIWCCASLPIANMIVQWYDSCSMAQGRWSVLLPKLSSQWCARASRTGVIRHAVCDVVVYCIIPLYQLEMHHCHYNMRDKFQWESEFRNHTINKCIDVRSPAVFSSRRPLTFWSGSFGVRTLLDMRYVTIITYMMNL